MKKAILTLWTLVWAFAASAADVGRWCVEAIAPDIICCSYSASGDSIVKPVLVRETRTEAKVKLIRNGNVVTLVTGGGITASVNGPSLTVSAGKGRVLNIPDFPVVYDGEMSLAIYGFIKQYSLYGAGERGHSLDFKNEEIENYNCQNYGYTDGDPRISQMSITMPLIISDHGYALLFDDFAPSRFNISENGEVLFVTENKSSNLTFYYIKGDTQRQIAERLTSLTGRQEMPPLWSLGYITSKYGYYNQAETVGIVDTLKREGYPLDGIVLDSYWYGKEQDMGSLSWDPNKWPDHRKMLSEIKARGVNVVAISQPYVLKNGRGADNYNALSKKRMFGLDSFGNTLDVKISVGEGGLFDVSNPKTCQWLRNRYKQLTDEGVAGWWSDLGEPEVHPESMVHHNGLTAREYHNRYGNDWSRIIYDMFKEEYPSTRLMTLMRGGTIGLQRYSVFPWSTDVSRSWGGLQSQIKIMLNSGMSGLGYMSHDVGVFDVDSEYPVDPELYVRWLQLGTFSPVLMAEPYKYQEYRDIILPLVKERYRWLPYNYTLAYENASYGYPLVRPLNFNEANLMPDDQYLWGDNVMVAPVLEKGATSRQVWIPEGIWLDMRDPSKSFEPLTTVICDAPLSVLPMFVKAGSFIVTADYPMENTADYDPARYTVNYYPARGVESETSGYVYEDDLTTPNDGSSHGVKVMFRGTTTPQSTNIEISTVDNGLSKFANKNLTFKIYNVARAESVALSGKNIEKIEYDKFTRTLSFTISYTVGYTDNITIKY